MNLPYHRLLVEQQRALDFRQRMLRGGLSDSERSKVDRETEGRLLELSPGKLAPVLVRREFTPPEAVFAAYLIGPTNKGGSRLLVKEKVAWRILWVKASAEVKVVHDRGKHDEIVSLQGRVRELLGSIFVGKNGKCHTVNAKGSRKRKSKKPSGRCS